MTKDLTRECHLSLALKRWIWTNRKVIMFQQQKKNTSENVYQEWVIQLARQGQDEKSSSFRQGNLNPSRTEFPEGLSRDFCIYIYLRCSIYGGMSMLYGDVVEKSMWGGFDACLEAGKLNDDRCPCIGLGTATIHHHYSFSQKAAVGRAGLCDFLIVGLCRGLQKGMYPTSIFDVYRHVFTGHRHSFESGIGNH
ncbi:hypothetical protein TNCV_3072121 [Trichonephila clavipes]|nr:hypothetical protein TNCV_3072121 [Trichonephila clavipes]